MCTKSGGFKALATGFLLPCSAGFTFGRECEGACCEGGCGSSFGGTGGGGSGASVSAGGLGGSGFDDDEGTVDLDFTGSGGTGGTS